MSTETHVGPVTTPPQYRKILDYIEVARKEGAKCVLGGKPYAGDGVRSDRICATNHLHRSFQSNADRPGRNLRAGSLRHSL